MKNQSFTQAFAKLIGIIQLCFLISLPFQNHAQDCNTSPVITCPANYFGCPGDDTDPSNTGFATAVPGEAGCEDPEVTYTDLIMTTGPCTGQTLIKRIWLAQYPNNTNPWLFAECTQIILLEDLEAPVFTTCPADITIDMSDCDNPVWDDPIVTDNCDLMTVSSDYNSGAEFPQGTTIVTYTAEDACGNTNTCQFSVTILGACCEAPPSIECPNVVNICPGESTDPADTGIPTITANPACGPYTVDYDDAPGSDENCAGLPLVRRTWTVTYDDHPGLTSSCLQRIKFVDNQNPVFFNCPSDITIDESGVCEENVSWVEPTSSDNCGIASVTSNHNPGDLFPVGNTQVVYTATDNCGNTAECSFIVTVIDNCCTGEAPTIVCPTNYITCPNDDDLDPSITGYPIVTDNADCGPYSLDYVDVETTNDNSCNGHPRINRVWTVSYDNNPNLTATCTQKLIFRDVTAPVIASCPNDLFFNIGDNVVWTSPTVSDDCSMSSFSTTHSPGDAFPVGETQVTYTAIDNCGNISYCSFKVTVESGSGLTLDCPDDITVSCGDDLSDWITTPTYTTSCGACDGNNNIDGFIYMGSLNGHKYYCSMFPTTWEYAEDYCQQYGGYLATINSSQENYMLSNFLTIQSAYIGLNDVNQEGNFEWSNGEPLTYTNWYPGQPNDYLQGQDYCEILNNGQWNDQYDYKKLEFIMEVPCVTITQTGGPYLDTDLPGGTYTVTYSANDACGNSASCSFDVTIESSIEISCPNDVTLSCPYNTNGLIVNWNIPEVNTCCNSGYAGDIPGFIYMGGYGGSNYYCTLEPYTWDQGSSLCQSNGGYLTTINDAGENEFLANILTIQSCYIGLNDVQQEGTFSWVNGEPSNYTNWYPGQPNNFNGIQDHCEMLSNGQWNDQYYYKKLECVCEMPGALTITQIAGPPPGSLFQKGTTTTITYQATDGCGNSATCSFDITIEGDNCDPNGMNAESCWIESVRFDQYKLTSGNDWGYGDHTDHCMPVGPNSSYQIGLEPACSNQKAYWSIYIDFNQDGDFSDSGEFMAYGNSVGPISGIINLPFNIWNGDVTMRILMHKGGYANGPCDSSGYGEIEDYCLRVTGADALPDNPTESRSEVNEPIELGLVEVELSVYPNPATDRVYIDNINKENISKVDLVNIDGTVIKQINWAEHKSDYINVSDQITGSYILNIHLEDQKEVISKKLIINRD